MNSIFSIICLLSCVVLLIFNPTAFITAFQSGGETAFDLFCKLVILYGVWLGFFGIVEKTNINKKIAKLFGKFNKFTFGNISEDAKSSISLNLSCGFLGLGSASMAMGLSAMKQLEGDKKQNAMTMLFVLNVTAIQILPSSVIALKTQYGSTSPADIILPVFITTTAISVIGILLCKIFGRKNANGNF